MRVNADWRLTSRHFAQLGQDNANTIKSQLQARATTMFGPGMSAGVSYLSSTGHEGTPNRRQYSAQLRKGWGRFNLTGSFDRLMVTGQPRDDRFLLTANLRLGPVAGFARVVRQPVRRDPHRLQPFRAR